MFVRHAQDATTTAVAVCNSTRYGMGGVRATVAEIQRESLRPNLEYHSHNCRPHKTTSHYLIILYSTLLDTPISKTSSSSYSIRGVSTTPNYHSLKNSHLKPSISLPSLLCRTQTAFLLLTTQVPPLHPIIRPFYYEPQPAEQRARHSRSYVTMAHYFNECTTTSPYSFNPSAQER